MVVFCVILSWTATAQSQQAVPAVGEPFQAEIGSIDSNWEVTFQCGETKRNVLAGDLVWWGKYLEPPISQELILADGGILVADLYRVANETLVVDSDVFGLVELPLECAAGAVLLPPADRHEHDLLLDKIVSAEGNFDRVMLVNGDELTGRAESIQDDVLTLVMDTVPVEVEMHRIQAIVFDPSLLRRFEPKGVRAITGLGDGSRLIASEVLVNQNSLAMTVAGGTKLESASTQLVCLQPLGGAVAYLSDREPAGSRQLPYLELSWPPYRSDRNIAGGFLRAGGRLYLKGLGVHSASRLTYLIDGGFRRFQADLAIDDFTSRRGSVQYVVYVDGEPKFISQIVRGGMKPVPVSIDVSGAKRLDLVVDFADRADVWDHANWLNARLIGQKATAHQ